MPYDLSGVSIVVADDNLHMQALVRGVLKAFSVKNIIAYSSGDAAYVELIATQPELAIVDWEMEPMSGIEFTRKVRLDAESPNPFLPIIMLTGYTDRARVFEARDAGVNEFMAKPVSPKTLYARIAAVIERPRPFVRLENFFGPDRRRRETNFKGADQRTTEPKFVSGDP